MPTRLFTLLCVTVLLTLPRCAQAAGASLPLLTRNQYIPFLAFFDPPPLPATPPHEWRLAVTLDYSSLFEEKRNEQNGGVVDLEVGRAAIHAGRRVSRRIAVDVEVPFIWTGGGFLDDFISDWHGTFGLPNGNRDRASSGLYRYHLTVDGQTVVDREKGGAGLGDVGTTLTYLLTEPDAPIAAAVRFGVKAPTAGNELSLRGSGGWDYAVGLIGERQWPEWIAAVHLAAVYPTGVSEVEVQPYATGLLSLTWRYAEGLDLLGELAGRTSPYDTGVEIFDNSALELRVGVRRSVGRRAAIEVAFVEDLSYHTTPDFTVHIAWRVTSGE